MARKPSVVLTPAEKKELVKSLKSEVKEAAAAVKALAAEQKLVAKARKAEDTEFNKRLAAAEKAAATATAKLEAAQQ